MAYQFRLRQEPFDFSYEFDDYENELLESDPEFADFEEEEEIRLRPRVAGPVSRGRPPPRRPRPPRTIIRPWRGSAVVIHEPSPCTCPEQICPQHGSEYIRWVQSTLNRILGMKMPLNGVLTPATRSAIRSFQEREKLPVTGIVGPDTEGALMAATVSTPASEREKFELFDPELADMEWEAEVDRSSREYLRWVQSSLNKILGLRLAVDGISGTATRSAVRSFQQQKGLTPDGIVGSITEAALIAAGASAPPAAGTISTPSTGTNPNVNALLPASGPGFYSYYSDAAGKSHQYGQPETVRAIQAIGAAWQRRYPRGPRIGVGHISLRGGGYTSAHKGHQNGLEVDFRPVRNDGREASVTITDAFYSRSLTQELVNVILANGVLKVDRILFNGTGVTPVIFADGHHNHLHVYFLPPVVQPAIGPSSYVPSRTTSTTLPLAWGAKVSPAFRARVRQIGGELGINPNFLMAVMAFETNETFDPSIRNPYSGATGLIQFTATTAGKLGTSTDSLARMSAEQQLDYVAAYFRPYKGKLKTIEDVYMAVLYGPEAVGVPNDTVLFSTPSREYEWNKALDGNRDGRITKAEAAAPVIARLNKGMQAALQGELQALENPWGRELGLSGRLQEAKWESPFSEAEEVELAAELLSVSNEEELDQFLGKLFRGAWKGIKKVGSAVGKIAKPLGGVLKGVAKAALPFVGGALGSFIPIPGVGTAIGSALGGALSKALEMELAELNQEEQEFEMARRFVRIAGTAAQQAALASPSTDPQAAVKSGLVTAARRHVGNLPDIAIGGNMMTGRSSGSARSGRWVRR